MALSLGKADNESTNLGGRGLKILMGLIEGRPSAWREEMVRESLG